MFHSRRDWCGHRSFGGSLPCPSDEGVHPSYAWPLPGREERPIVNSFCLQKLKLQDALGKPQGDDSPSWWSPSAGTQGHKRLLRYFLYHACCGQLSSNAETSFLGMSCSLLEFHTRYTFMGTSDLIWLLFSCIQKCKFLDMKQGSFFCTLIWLHVTQWDQYNLLVHAIICLYACWSSLVTSRANYGSICIRVLIPWSFIFGKLQNGNTTTNMPIPYLVHLPFY